MARYFFHIRNGGDFVEDREGTEMPGLEHARLEAMQSAREIVAELIKSDRTVGLRQIEIADVFGLVLAVVPYSSIIRLH